MKVLGGEQQPPIFLAQKTHDITETTDQIRCDLERFDVLTLSLNSEENKHKSSHALKRTDRHSRPAVSLRIRYKL